LAKSSYNLRLAISPQTPILHMIDTVFRPRGIRNLILINSTLGLWFVWRVVGALGMGAGGVAALQVGPLLALIAAGPLLLWRAPVVHRLAVAAVLLGIIWTATAAFVQLAMRGLWDISLDAVTGVALAIYLVGVHGYLRHAAVRAFFAST
jgi:hypothetical protein